MRFAASLLITALLAPVCLADDKADVLAVVDRVFDGMRAKDAPLLLGQFDSAAKIGKLSVEEFATAVSTSKAHLDEVTFDETVLIDGDLAMAWTPYNIFVDGEFHHCGVDLFVMKHNGERWLIHQPPYQGL